MHLMKFTRNLKAGETYRFSIAGSSITSAHHDDPLNEAERMTIFAKLEGRDRLLNFHHKAWDEIWKSDIKSRAMTKVSRIFIACCIISILL